MSESTGAIEQWRKIAAGCDTSRAASYRAAAIIAPSLMSWLTKSNDRYTYNTNKQRTVHSRREQGIMPIVEILTLFDLFPSYLGLAAIQRVRAVGSLDSRLLVTGVVES